MYADSNITSDKILCREIVFDRIWKAVIKKAPPAEASETLHRHRQVPTTTTTAGVSAPIISIGPSGRGGYCQRGENMKPKITIARRLCHFMRKIHRLLIYCKMPLCHAGCWRRGIKRRQSTAYGNDKLNWVVLCDECFGEQEAYWKERWDDYYRNCM